MNGHGAIQETSTSVPFRSTRSSCTCSQILTLQELPLVSERDTRTGFTVRPIVSPLASRSAEQILVRLHLLRRVERRVPSRVEAAHVVHGLELVTVATGRHDYLVKYTTHPYTKVNVKIITLSHGNPSSTFNTDAEVQASVLHVGVCHRISDREPDDRLRAVWAKSRRTVVGWGQLDKPFLLGSYGVHYTMP